MRASWPSEVPRAGIVSNSIIVPVAISLFAA